MTLSAVALTLFCVSGCGGKRTIFINASFNSSDVVRLGDDVKGHVYFPTDDGGWELSANKVTLPEGWYALPISDTDD